ncbi:MAG: nitrite reductase [Streptosporangiales bacterium]|nr:nitrite reductase [Streptosporangiales bacterium]
MKRTRRDRCPGVLRPWPADDGLLVRLRLIGGRVPSSALRSLADVARAHGDGRVYVTVRANLQVRGLRALPGSQLDPAAMAAIEKTGLVPSPRHDLVRNVLVSPQTGLADTGTGRGGRADLRPVAAELDRLLLASERLSGLPGRFLFVLDDGRGDILDRDCDLGLVALGPDTVQLRVGRGWGPVVPVREAAGRLTGLAREFLTARGSGPGAPWHVAELPEPLRPPAEPDPRIPEPGEPLPYGDVPGGRHIPVPDEGLTPASVAELTAGVPGVIVTPWKGVLVPDGWENG